MINKKHNASVVVIALMVILGISYLLMLAKDQFIHNNRMTNQYILSAIQDKALLYRDVNILESQEINCNVDNAIFPDKKNKNKKEIIIKYKMLTLRYLCERIGFFKEPPSAKKYIQLKNFNDTFDLARAEIISISSLAELPESSIANPKIVFATQDIDDTLEKDFYGIILTESYFDIKGSYKIYGQIYSVFNNKRTERNLSYKREVIENIDKLTSRWEYVKNSKRIAENEEAP